MHRCVSQRPGQKGGRGCDKASKCPPSIHMHINAVAQLVHEHCLPNLILHNKPCSMDRANGAFHSSEVTPAVVHAAKRTGSLAMRGEITTVLTLLLSKRADLQCKAESTAEARAGRSAICHDSGDCKTARQQNRTRSLRAVGDQVRKVSTAQLCSLVCRCAAGRWADVIRHVVTCNARGHLLQLVF